MKIHNKFVSKTGRSVMFRRVHPKDSFKGLAGLFAVTTMHDFVIQPLHFEAANDLGCVSGEKLGSNSAYTDHFKLAKIEIAVCVLPECPMPLLEDLANDLNMAIDYPPEAA